MIDKSLVGMGWMEISNYNIIRRDDNSTLQDKNEKKVIPKCQL